MKHWRELHISQVSGLLLMLMSSTSQKQCLKETANLCLQGKCYLHFIDLETTDLMRGGKYPHITQIAASVVGSVSEFSAYVYPKVPIASTAQQIAGIIVNNSGTTTVHGQQVHAEDLSSSIDKFCKWLKRYASVYLIAHNGRKFDFPILMNAMMNIKSEAEFLDCVIGCIDSLSIFKKAFTSQSYKQEELSRTILNTPCDAHNAMEVVKVLGKLIFHTKCVFRVSNQLLLSIK
ncbi:uncharacterized protein LOC134238121 [Saccostrea cucullata]|uniref:uncharacterized protein LOC134238121 n=1 Tax=Saccostrea cuccullata TaxID=36930 RepID=UPI002ED3A219